MVFAVLPSFLTEELLVSHKSLGVIEGVALFLSFFAKVFSGVWSDYIRSRKPIIILGSLLTVVSKPCFAIAIGLKSVFLARTLDRFSKGIRSAPTDALLADLSSSESYGKVYGLRQSLYTLGAVFGASITMALIYFFGPNFRMIFCLSALPASLAVLILVKKVMPKLSNSQSTRRQTSVKFAFKDLSILPKEFWVLMSIVMLLMMARFSEMFINLRVRELGLSVSMLPLVIIIMDLVHVAMAYPFGKLADSRSKNLLLFFGMLIQASAALLMSSVTTLTMAMVGVVLIGVYMGMTQGILRAMIAEVTPASMRGTAFAIFYFVSGSAILFGNTLAGFLSDEFGLHASFLGGFFFSSAAALSLYFWRVRKSKIVLMPS